MSPIDPIPVDPPVLLLGREIAIAGRLCPLDVSWHGGQLVALLGPNGSGKSSLLGALAGIEPATGTLLLAGESVGALSWPELAKRRAMLPQRQPQLFDIPVFEVLRLGLAQEASPHQQQAALTSVCETLALTGLLGRTFSQLSGGEQQRVLIARTVLQVWPSLAPLGQMLLLDEPLAGLDLHHQLALLGLLKKLASEGLLVVLAIHDINLAIDWADRIMCLVKGQRVCEGGVELIDEALLAQVFHITTTRIEGAGRVWFMPVGTPSSEALVGSDNSHRQ
ncbi:MAG: ATP-binding cassette domain-containing protein [Aeromonas sp.]